MYEDVFHLWVSRTCKDNKTDGFCLLNLLTNQKYNQFENSCNIIILCEYILNTMNFSNIAKI